MYDTTSVILITVIKHGSRKSSPTRIRTSGEIPGLRFTTSAYTHTPVVFTSLADCLCGFFLNTRSGYEAVLNTFPWWHQSPEMLKQLHGAPISGPVNEVLTDEERTLRFEHQLKVSPVKNMRLIKEELDKAYKDRRDQFLREMEGLLTERGYVKGPSKIEEDHYKWLVLYNCLHWSFSEIAKHEEKSLKTIRDGVQIAAARIGIVIRPSGRPGRPKKSS